MNFPNGSEPLSGWRVRFPIKGARATESYRVVDLRENRAFLKIFDLDQVPAEGFDCEGKLLELAIMERLQHAFIPSIIQSGELGDGRRSYLLAELIPGETLDLRLARNFALPPHRAKSLMEDLLKAVAYLHALSDPVVHNEIAPSNIILDARTDRNESPVLVDFGHARRRSDGDGQGSTFSDVDPFYLPNECLEGAVWSTTTDVFALGAMYFRVIFGTPPWGEGVGLSESGNIRKSILKARRESPSVPAGAFGDEFNPSVLSAIEKALSSRPDDRFPDACAFLAAVAKPRTAPSQKSQSSIRFQRKLPAHKKHGFDAIAGMSELKRILSEDVVNALREPDEYQRFGLSLPNGLLLYGPPGCGKTFIAERFGEELGFAFRKVIPSTVASPYIHGTNIKTAQLFDEAKRDAPCVLFLDEVDALIPSRESELHHAYASTVDEWLAQMSGCGEKGVFLVAASNRPRRLDPAVLRAGRIDKVAYVGPPDHHARRAMFEIHLSHRPIDDAIDYDELARLTQNRVSSDIKFLVDESARDALSSSTTTIQMSHLVAAIQRNGPSVGPRMLAEYESMRREFESERSTTRTSRTIGFVRPSGTGGPIS